MSACLPACTICTAPTPHVYCSREEVLREMRKGRTIANRIARRKEGQQEGREQQQQGQQQEEVVAAA